MSIKITNNAMYEEKLYDLKNINTKLTNVTIIRKLSKPLAIKCINNTYMAIKYTEKTSFEVFD